MRNQIKFLIGLGVFFGLSAGAIGGLLFFLNTNPDSDLGIFDSINEATSKSASTVEIDRAVQAAVQRHPEVLAYTIYNVSVDHVDFSPDGRLALAWLALTDKESGKVIPAEPGLAIVVQTGDAGSSTPIWEAYVQADASWNDQMALVPADMLNEEARIQFTSPDQPISKAVPFTGYRLPWVKGSKKLLTGSIGHVFTYKSCPSSCLYAFDFADGTMFQVLAAKGGVVKQAVWGYANGNTSNANYLLIEDSSTNPVSYMIYMHFAQNSIPEALRTPGAVVRQGQFLGNADDTGYSTGHHLHFHVHTNPLSYWGNSVDILFEDVTINGGRPRTCSEANAYPEYGGQCQTNDSYTSGNGDSTPPYGGLSLPQAGQTINTASITVSGWGQDDIAVTKMQPVVNYDGIWRPIGTAQTTSPFTTEVNLCEAGVPDSPLSIGLIVYDRAGNQSAVPQGQRVLTKEYACDPQPAVCQPSDDQAAIFVNKAYQGPCQILEVGNYSDLGSYPNFGDNNLESIMVGANVTAAVFDTSAYKDRVESFTASDENLADNLIGIDRASSIRVLKNPITPAVPVLNNPASAGDDSPTSQNSLTLSWLPAVGAVDYRSELSGPDSFVVSLDWSKTDSWSVGSLPAGDYSWTVWDRNGEKGNQANMTFSITDASLSSASPLTVPYKADFESNATGWTSTGFWKRSRLSWGELETTAWFTGDTNSYGSSNSLSADLTSPLIQIPYEGLALQFSYFSETESAAIFRDQRWVQISEDGGPFKNILQILDTTESDSWIQDKTIDLTPYAGHSIRVRFHFDAVDTFYNDYFGWAVDNFIIDADETQLCGDQPGDETPQNASALEINAQVEGSLCPDGDIDYFKFTAVKDQNLTAVVSLSETAMAWQPILTFVSSDGKTSLAETAASSEPAPFTVTIKAPENGDYYLKVTSGSQDSGLQVKPYSLRILSDSTAPQITVLAPTAEQPLTGFPFTISLDVNDGEGSGVAGIEFWWHSKSWANDKWELLGHG
ncbi:MAG: peptidoglycan DD-metalloendopeptidase family protein [Anaerolineaceae bacterium]